MWLIHWAALDEGSRVHVMLVRTAEELLLDEQRLVMSSNSNVTLTSMILTVISEMLCTNNMDRT